MTFSETPAEDRHEAVSGTTDLRTNSDADLGTADESALPATDGIDTDGFTAHAGNAEEANAEGHPQRWWILGFLCLSLVLIVASVSSVNVALPSIQRDLDASGSDLQWIVDSYALFFAGMLLPLGAIGDYFGRRRVLIAGLLIFGVATGIAAASTAAYQIIVMRAIMGTAAALIMPATLSILTEVFSKRELPKAIAVWAAFAGAGGMIGPVGAGLVLKWFWWGGVFALTIPLVLVGLFGAICVVPSSRNGNGEHPFDPLGALLSIVIIGAFVFGVIEGPNYGWTDSAILGMFIIAALAGIIFYFWEKKVPHPMLDPNYFRSRRFNLSALAMTVMFFGLFGWLFMLTQYFQFAQGHSPLDAGLRMMPSAVVMLIVAPRSANIAAAWGTRKIVSRGLFMVSLGIAGLALITPETPYWVAVICLVVGALGGATLMPTVTERIVSSLPPEKAGVGSAMNDTTREVGGSIGIAIVGSLLAVGYRRGIDSTVSDLSGQLRESGGAGNAAGAADLGTTDLGAAGESGVAALAGMVESAQDSIGRALGAAQGLAEAGFGDFANRLAESATSAFNEGMTLGLGVIAGIVFLTSIVIGLFYPDDEAESSADLGAAETGKHESVKAETGGNAMLTAETQTAKAQTAEVAPKAASEGDGGQR